MSAEATAWVWKNSPYTGAQLLVHLAIGDVANDVHENKFWMSTYKLADKARVSRSTVVTTLGDMVRDGHLEVIKPGVDRRSPAVYLFKMTRPTTGLAADLLGQSGESSRPIEDEPLGQPSRHNSKEITKKHKAAEVFKKDEEWAAEAAPPPWKQLGLTHREWLELEQENA